MRTQRGVAGVDRAGLGRSTPAWRFVAVLVLAVSVPGLAARPDSMLVGSNLPWPERIARSFLVRHPGAVTYDSATPDRRWNYEQGLMLRAFLRMEEGTGDGRYFAFVKENIDQYVDTEGVIRTYDLSSYNLDNIAPGRALLALYRRTGEGRYRAAAEVLRSQLRDQPRTREGGFWHKKIYPYQMWLDGLYMAGPFYAEYAVQFGDSSALDDVVRQFVLVEKHTRDRATGLLYHAWDASRQQRWADSLTGRSPNFWSRSMGWYAMGLVDVLDVLPRAHPGRRELLRILTRLAAALWRARDTRTSLWYQLPAKPLAKGNYLEASGSAMFAYAFARGANKGYLPILYRERARRVFRGILENLVTVGPDGQVSLHRTVRVGGLGGSPYRDGSVAYYLSEPLRTNDMKGVGPFLLAAIELEGGQK